MKTHGFIPALPLWVTKTDHGKLKIMTGHHRFNTAIILGLPVYYIEYDLPVNLFSLEGTKQQWSLEDFCEARKASGHQFSTQILEMKERTGLPLGTCVAAMKGHTTGSNAVPDIKQGKDVAAKTDVAFQVESFVNAVRPAIGDKAIRSTFGMCVLMCVISDMVDMKKLKDRIIQNPQKITPFSTRDECLKVLETVYNFRSREHVELVANVKASIASRNATCHR